MKLTKQEVLTLNANLTLVENLGGAKFSYAIARNMSKLKPEIGALQKAYFADEEFGKYDVERKKLIFDNAVMGEDGQPKTDFENGVEIYVLKDKPKFDKEIKELQEKFKSAIEKRQQQMKDFEDILKEEVEVDLYMVKSENLPEAITPKQTDGIIKIIED